VFATIKGKTKEGSEIGVQTKILEGVADATTPSYMTSKYCNPIFKSDIFNKVYLTSKYYI